MAEQESTYPPLGKAERIELVLSYTLKGIIAFTIIMSVISFEPFLFASGIVILLFSALPAIIGRRLRITLPVEVDFVITVFIFLHFILGEAGNYYNRFWWFDLLLHTSSGIIIGIVGFVIIYFILFTQRIEANPALATLFSVSFSLAAGALWEIFEFFMDMTFGFNMQKSGLVDTMSDLIVDFLGACIVGLWAFRYLKKDEDGIIKTVVHRFIHYNLRWQTKREERRRRSPGSRLRRFTKTRP